MTEAVPKKPEAIVALDVPTLEAARLIVIRLGDSCNFYKVGLELFTGSGPEAVKWLRGEGKDIFLDLKLHDIPNTVRGAAKKAASLGARLLTVHAEGGPAMLDAAVAGAREGSSECGVLVVTVLTSMDRDALALSMGQPQIDLTEEVMRRAALAAAAGAHGVVCSGHEVAAVRSEYPSLMALVPGIRLDGTTHDQARVVTPEQAVSAGARYIVVGRAVTADTNPVAAMRRVSEGLKAATTGSPA